MTYLAVPIAAENVDDTKEQITRASRCGAELLELRVDYLKKLTPESVKTSIKLVKTAKLPVIVTCRDTREGGKNDHPQQLRTQILADAIAAGADFVDCEYNNFKIDEVARKIKSALEKNSKTRLILSAHDFKSSFADINSLYNEILKTFPLSIPKLIYTAGHINDCFEGFDLLHNKKSLAIVFCMGPAGQVSRIIAKKLGSFVTFAGLDETTVTAPGQLTAKQLKEIFRYDNIDESTELFGIIGDPVGHSLSPAVHNACFVKEQMNKLYLPILLEGSAEKFNEFMENCRQRNWLSFAGFSVTLPHKVNALDYVKQSAGLLDPLAEKIGAVNTLTIDKAGDIKGFNTDYAGALDAVTTAIDKKDLKGIKVAIIGAGGVSRAIVAGFSQAGANITIYNRTVEKGRKLAEHFDCKFKPLTELANINAQMIINCTNIGMHPNISQSILPKEVLKKDMVIFDTIYNPLQTLLLKQAVDAGAKTVDGLAMFAGQAAEQFKLFTDRDMDPWTIRKIAINSAACKK